MSTKEILLILLSLIILSAAHASGSSMFSSKSYKASKALLAADAQSFATQVVQYYKTPVSQGGMGGNLDETSVRDIGAFLGWDGSYTKIDGGHFRLARLSAENKTVVIIAYGNDTRDSKNPKIVTTITFPEGTIKTIASDEAMPPNFIPKKRTRY